jgi:hypothetical protein
LNANNILKWAATSILIVGAMLLSVDVYPLGGIVENVGTLVFFIWSVRVKETALVVVNGALFLIYTSGLLVKLAFPH